MWRVGSGQSEIIIIIGWTSVSVKPRRITGFRRVDNVNTKVAYWSLWASSGCHAVVRRFQQKWCLPCLCQKFFLASPPWFSCSVKYQLGAIMNTLVHYIHCLPIFTQLASRFGWIIFFFFLVIWVVVRTPVRVARTRLWNWWPVLLRCVAMLGLDDIANTETLTSILRSKDMEKRSTNLFGFWAICKTFSWLCWNWYPVVVPQPVSKWCKLEAAFITIVRNSFCWFGCGVEWIFRCMCFGILSNAIFWYCCAFFTNWVLLQWLAHLTIFFFGYLVIAVWRRSCCSFSGQFFLFRLPNSINHFLQFSLGVGLKGLSEFFNLTWLSLRPIFLDRSGKTCSNCWIAGSDFLRMRVLALWNSKDLIINHDS